MASRVGEIFSKYFNSFPLGAEQSVHPKMYEGLVFNIFASFIATVRLMSIVPFSYLWTVALFTPMLSPTCSKVRPCNSRSCLILSPIFKPTPPYSRIIIQACKKINTRNATFFTERLDKWQIVVYCLFRKKQQPKKEVTHEALYVGIRCTAL